MNVHISKFFVKCSSNNLKTFKFCYLSPPTKTLSQHLWRNLGSLHLQTTKYIHTCTYIHRLRATTAVISQRIRLKFSARSYCPAASYIKNYYDDFMRSKCRLII